MSTTVSLPSPSSNQPPLVTTLLLASYPVTNVVIKAGVASGAEALAATQLSAADGLKLSGDFAVARQISKGLGLYPTDSKAQSIVRYFTRSLPPPRPVARNWALA